MVRNGLDHVNIRKYGPQAVFQYPRRGNRAVAHNDHVFLCGILQRVLEDAGHDIHGNVDSLLTAHLPVYMFHAHPQYGPQLLPYHLAHVREGLLYLCQRRVMFRRYIEEQPVLHDAQMGSQLQHRVIPLLKLQLQGILYLCNQLFGNEDIFHIDVLGRAELAQGHPLCMDKEHFILIHVQTGPVRSSIRSCILVKSKPDCALICV